MEPQGILKVVSLTNMIRNMSFYQTCSSTSTNNQSRILNPESRHASIQYKVENAYPFSSRWPIRSFWSRLGISPHGILSSLLLALRHPSSVGLTASLLCWPYGILSPSLPYGTFFQLLELLSSTTADDALLRRHQSDGWRLHVALWVSSCCYLNNMVKPRSVSGTQVSGQP